MSKNDEPYLRKSSALKLFTRTSSRRTFNIASYHSPHSLTWSWVLSITFDGTWRRMNCHFYSTNGGPQWSLAVPFVVINWHRQREMWFRDIYRRASDERERLERTVSKLRRELTMARATAMLGADEGKPQ